MLHLVLITFFLFRLAPKSCPGSLFSLYCSYLLLLIPYILTAVFLFCLFLFVYLFCKLFFSVYAKLKICFFVRKYKNCWLAGIDSSKVMPTLNLNYQVDKKKRISFEMFAISPLLIRF